MKRQCELCGKILNRYNPGYLCYACQEKRAEERANRGDKLHYDAEDMAYILDLQSTESVKRLARKDKLPSRIPGIRKYLWLKEDIDAWIRSGYHSLLNTSEEDKAIKLALKKGAPIEQITLYGYYPQGLIEWYRAEIGLSKVG